MHTSHSLGKVLPLAATFAVALALVLPLTPAGAAELKQARVSQVVKDVKLLPGQAAPRPASVSDEVRDGTAVRTGTESRAELTFTDATLARLGANTIFSFNEGTRNLELGGGAMLLRVPKNSGGAKINTAAITAAITGTTIMLEYHPDAYVKFIVLEGTGRIYRNNRVGESVLLHAGQMLIVNPNGDGLPDPVDVDLKRLMETSLLINGFRTLPSDDLIAREINGQFSKKSEGELIETNLMIFGRGTAVTLLDPTMTDLLDQANANEARQPSPEPTVTPTPTVTVTPTPTVAPPTPTPAKFGALTVISTPAPYVIKSSTLIQTDPRITTDGRTDFGRIYRGPELDGAASQYLFGSTSEFDLNSGFNEHFGSAQNEPMAAFKFSSLILAGNPTISLANGGATKLALISVGNIISGTAMTTLTFAGIDSLLLATQNGSITLGSNLTFQNIPTLFLYARGLGSTLTFGSTVTGTTNLVLFSEGDIQVTDSLTVNQTSPNGFTDGLFTTIIAGQALNVGGDLVLSIDSSGTNNDSGINVATNTGDITIGGLLGLAISSTSGEVANGASLNVNAGGNLSVGSLNLTVDVASDQVSVANGANIGVQTGGDFSIVGDALISVLNNGGGNIGNGGSIFILAGGDLTAGSITALVNNRDGGTITTGGNLVLDIGGTLATTGDASFIVSNRDDGGGGGTIRSGGAVSLNLGSASIGGDLLVGLTPGTTAEALNTIFVAGDLNTGGGLDFNTQNGGLNINDVSIGGLAIGGDDVLSLTAASLSNGDFLNVFLSNLDGGSIGANATIGIDVAGAITVQTNAIFQLINSRSMGTLASSIGSDASVGISASSLSADSIFAQVFNTGGSSIGGNADLFFASTGAITSVGDATFRIVNFDNGAGFGGGSIGGDATINISAASLSAATLLTRLNNLGGNITGDSNITFAIDGALTTTGDATFDILQDDPQSSLASLTVTAGSFSVGGALVVRISDLETSFLIQNVALSAATDITVANNLSVDGNISAEGNINAAGGIFTPGDPTTVAAGGTITAPGIITGSLNASGKITIDNTAGTFDFGIIANSITTGGTLRLLNSPSISPNNASSDGTIGFTFDDFFLTVASIVSTGPTIPVLSSNGSDTDPNVANGNPGNGGNITLNLPVSGLTIGSAGDLARIEANGGAFANGAIGGGNGGTVDITATGDVTLIDGNITASSGVNPTGTPAGNGGTVNITSRGAITVNSTIEASSNTTNGLARQSAKGGNVNLTSTKATGIAINVGNTGQLLALLDQAATGPGGKITILATGASSDIDAKGNIVADRGTVDIRHTGANGEIYLGGAPTDFLSAHANVLKVGALGANGVLTVGNGSLTADSVLKLYAPSSNGQLNFIQNVTISSGTDAILAAGTITIQPTVTVTVQGNGGPAQVFTNNPNYSGFGGNNPTNGTFGGNGANNPLPLSQAPAFDGPPGG